MATKRVKAEKTSEEREPVDDDSFDDVVEREERDEVSRDSHFDGLQRDHS